MKTKELPWKLYDLIPSQATMYMMVKYSLHKNLVQVPTSFAVDYDIDFDLFQRAFNIEMERNDSLRLRFVKVDGTVKQYFLPSDRREHIEVLHFANKAEQDAFFEKDAQKAVAFTKETFRIYFFHTDGVGNGMYFNITHLAMDAMGIIIMYFDLLSIYRTLVTGCEMPKPLASYEDYILAEYARLADQKKMARHADFYKHYFLKGGEPMYAGVHGPQLLEKTRKRTHNPDLRIPSAYNPLYDKCDFVVQNIAADDAKEIFDYCLQNKIAPETLLQFGLRTYCSAANARTPDVFMMSLCSKRATGTEKRTGGCMAQPLQLRTILPETLTFEEALESMTFTRTQLFRHSAYPYPLALKMLQGLYNHKPTQGAASMMFSWIPVPLGSLLPFNLDFRAYNLGRYFTPLYVISHPDPTTNGIRINYMYRVKFSDQADIQALHENAVKVILAGIRNPSKTVGELLDQVQVAQH